MATTVGSHSVASFTAPINGTSPIDANSVRNNDNTLRTSYVAHDADAGIHVQSSALASRPAASAAGRKWVTADAGSYKLWYDDGARWHEIGGDAIELEVAAGEVLAKGDVVSVTGYNTGLNLATVTKYTGAAPAFGITSEAIGNGARGYIINTGYITDIKTDTFGATGTILYPAATGTFTSTKPTSGQYQVSAYVLRSNASNGVLYVEFSASRIVERSDNTASTIVLRDGSGNFTAGTITANLTGNVTGTAATVTGAAQAAITSLGTLTALQVDNLNVNGNAITSTSGGISITPLAGQVITLDGTITVDAGVVANATSITSTAFVGALTGNAATATALETARTINGVSFDGTANISVESESLILAEMQDAVIDLSGGSEVTVTSVSVPSIAVGDIIEVSLTGLLVQNGGGTPSIFVSVTIGSTAVVATRTLFAAPSSSANERAFRYVARVVVQSTSVVLAIDEALTTTTALTSLSIPSAISTVGRRTTDNLTGTQTLALKMLSGGASSALTQTVLPAQIIVRRYAGV